MRSQVGPASKELTSVEVAEAFLAAPEVSVVYFGGESKLKGKVQYRFVMVSDILFFSIPRIRLNKEITFFMNLFIEKF